MQLRFREAQMIEELSEQKSMMFGHTTLQRQFQFRDLVPQQSFGQLCEPGSALPPGGHRFQHRSPRSTQSIGRYRSQLNVGILQHLLDDANIKLGSVATDALGASGRAMLEAMLAGEQDA